MVSTISTGGVTTIIAASILITFCAYKATNGEQYAGISGVV
jgi:hypothetical protein